MRRLVLQALRESHRAPLVAKAPSITEACSSLQQLDGFAALPAGAAPGVPEPAAQTGQPADPSYLSRRPVSETVREHLDCGRFSSLPSAVSHPLPRPAAQLDPQPDLQPELHIWKHGSPLCHIPLPSLSLDSRASSCQNERKVSLFSAYKDQSPLCYTPLSSLSLNSRASNLRRLSLFSHQSLVENRRGFKTSAGLLAEDESGGSDVVVKDDGAEVLDEKKPKYGPRRSKKIPREIIGSYDDEFEDELDLAEASPWQDVLYNIRPRVDKFLIDEMGANPPLDLEDLVATADDLGLVSEIPDEYAGLPLVLRWETRFVLAPGPSAQHGLNRKVKLQAYLRDLGLSNEEREKMIALVGPRYNARKDELTLISQRYPQREENRKDVLRILYALIDESKRAEKEEMAAAA